jgi:ubiquinone/menaquinone biosynthesis C-methylase UbiE
MYKLLENPLIFNMMQKIVSVFVGKAVRFIGSYIRDNCKGKVLDAGCGTGRYADLFDNNYYGIDMNVRYLRQSGSNNKNFICCDATLLPFADHAFDSIFSVSLFHHVKCNDTKKVFAEMVRVSKKEATIMIVDAFYPDSAFDIVGSVVIRMDRGKHARKKENFMKELEDFFHIAGVQRIPHSYPYTFYAFTLKAKQ